ncbi:MAG: hypothetical protein IJ131_10015, partial [Eggerthellaceae bacterium]|nr:hypothetical protein [Eggerthellaceae bacterium]
MNTVRTTTAPVPPLERWSIRELALEAVCLLALALCAIFYLLPAASVVALAVFVGYILFSFFRQPAFFLKYLPFIFAVVANIVGCAFCEFGSFELDELSAETHFVGSLPLLIMARWLFIALLFVADNRFGTQTRTQPNHNTEGTQFKERLVLTCEILAFALVALSFLHVIAHPSFAEGINRFKYDSLYITGLWKRIDAIQAYLMVFPAIAIRHNRRRALGITTIVLFCLYLFWTGEKFGSFFTVACTIGYVFYDKAIDLSPKMKAI